MLLKPVTACFSKNTKIEQRDSSESAKSEKPARHDMPDAAGSVSVSSFDLPGFLMLYTENLV